VTGNNVYKYFKIQDGQQLKTDKREMQKKDAQISNHYTCHAWLPEGRIIVCTDQGELLLLESSGDFKKMLPESPGAETQIECIVTYQKGFFIGTDTGQIIIYERSEDPNNPYHRLPTTLAASAGEASGKNEKNFSHLQGVLMNQKIRAMAISKQEDMLIFTNEHSQLLKISVNLERPQDDAKFEFLIYPFHHKKIEGLDICIKKKLVATCG